MGEMKPWDEKSGLVERSWERKQHGEKAGVLTEETLEGEQVEATFLDRDGHLRREAGLVRRNDVGVLVVESWAEGVQKQTPVTRHANVDVLSRRPRSR
jgi:hypothetical protein